MNIILDKPSQFTEHDFERLAQRFTDASEEAIALRAAAAQAREHQQFVVFHETVVSEMEAAANEKVRVLQEACDKSAKVFRQYQDLHKAKGTVDGINKSLTNAQHAYLCEQALSATSDEPKGG